MRNKKLKLVWGVCFFFVGILLFFNVQAQVEKQKVLSSDSSLISSESKISTTEWQQPKFLPAGCTSEMVVDKATGKAIYQKNPNTVWPVASLTKTVSALALQQSGVDWDKIITAQDSDLDIVRQNTKLGDSVGNLRVVPGAKIRALDLLYASLVGSANNSAVALTRLVSGDYHTLVSVMNEIVKSNKLVSTYFVEPSGIDLKNVSTAKEFLVLWRSVVSDSLLNKVVQTHEYTLSIEPISGVPENHTVHHTNKLMRYSKRMLAGKTGYLDESGFNLVFWYKNKKGVNRLGIVLGCGSEKWMERRVSVLMEK